MIYPVKYTHSAMSGSPVISGTAGAMIAMLDAVLVNGFNILTPSSITVSAGVATATFSAGHGYLEYQIIKIAGATPTDLNGEQRVVSVTSTTLTFETIAADGTATGTLECRTAPVGTWKKVFSGTNKAVYRSIDLGSTGIYLRVDDSNAQYAICTMYETMTDVDTGTGASAVQYFRKSSTTDATARGWHFVGELRYFYLAVRWHASSTTVNGINRFGDFISYKVGDAYCCELQGDGAATGTNQGTYNSFTKVDGNEAYPSQVARSYTQVGIAIALHKCGSVLSPAMGYGGPAYPSPVDNGLLLHGPIILREGSLVTSAIRGYLPGCFQPVQNVPLTDGYVEKNVEQLPGRGVLVVACQSAGAEARAAFDITGPWR